MLFALDRNCNRIHIDATVKGEDYFCPCCESRLVLKKGTERIHHFAHPANSFCMDSWHYDMTEWHFDWQNKFPKECQEIVKEKDGQKHRADVLIEKEKVVFEFQHSQLSPYEFGERNAFYNALGYKVIWVFDVEDQYRNAQIENYNTNKWSWKWSKDTFNNFEAKDNRNTIYLQLENDEPFLIKVIWNAPNKGMSRFVTDGNDYDDDDLVYMFIFLPKEEKKEFRLSDLYDKLVLLSEKEHTHYYFGCPISATHKCADCSIDISESEYSEITPCEKCEFYDQNANYLNCDTLVCRKRFFDLGLDENAIVQVEEKDEYGFITKISYIENGEKKAVAIPSFDIRSHLKNVFDLWEENNCRVAIFRNVKTGKYVKITKDPFVQKDLYKRVYGYPSNVRNNFKHSNSIELPDSGEQTWVFVWCPSN